MKKKSYARTKQFFCDRYRAERFLNAGQHSEALRASGTRLVPTESADEIAKQ